MKNNIQRVVGNKCERCARKGKLQIHHIKPVAKANGVDPNVGSNLIAICGGCHDEVLTQAAMKKIVSKRSKKRKQEIKDILRNRKKLGIEKKASSKPVDAFGIGYAPFGLSDSEGKKKGQKKPRLVKVNKVPLTKSRAKDYRNYLIDIASSFGASTVPHLLNIFGESFHVAFSPDSKPPDIE